MGSGRAWRLVIGQGLQRLVLGRVVGDAVLPATPDDVGPGAGQDPHGCGWSCPALDHAHGISPATHLPLVFFNDH